MADLIYCAAGNKRFADIAIRYGFLYGAQLPKTVYHPPHFADQDWKKPNREKYMAALTQHQPNVATVLDLETESQFDEVMAWADEAAGIVSEAVIVIPKAMSIIDRLPHTIQGKQVRLGYSVPTKYGGTCVPVWEFGRRPVHLLGGSPNEQLKLKSYLNVQSADGNYAAKIAINFGKAWLQDHDWINPADLGLYERGLGDVMYFSFELSLMNIRAAWTGCKTSVRFAKESDIQSILKIAHQYRNELGYVNAAGLRENMARRSLIVATYSGVIVGFCNYRACRDGWQTVYEIAVDKSHRDENIGAGLLAAVPGPVRLKCTTDNTANKFYERQGFKNMGIHEGKKRPLNTWQRAR